MFVSRCIALPGDTIRVTHTGYRINGKEYPHSPHAQASYFMAQSRERGIHPSVKEIARAIKKSGKRLMEVLPAS